MNINILSNNKILFNENKHEDQIYEPSAPPYY